MVDQKLLHLFKKIQLPDTFIVEGKEISNQFLKKKLTTFHTAINHVYTLQYTPPSEPFNFKLVLDEERGTCSTKHALLVSLAQELNLPIQLGLGIYPLTPLMFPIIKDILKQYNIPYIPESHNFMVFNNQLLDITFPGACTLLSPNALIETETILPQQITTYKAEKHKQYLNKWFNENDFSFTPEVFYKARQLCIEALGDAFQYRNP